MTPMPSKIIDSTVESLKTTDKVIEDNSKGVEGMVGSSRGIECINEGTKERMPSKEN